MKNADTQNSTFANRTSRHTTKVCKRAVFFANAPNRIIKFDFLKLNIK